ncbi:MAG: hypothetical protein WDN24_13250 [Sphingomonas sp.]
MALFLFFLCTVAGFPWMLMRTAVAAVDRHLQIEVIDFLRRGGQLVCLVLLFAGGDLTTIFLALNLIWIGAFVLAFRNLRAGGVGGFAIRPARILDDLRAFRTNFGGSVLHSAVFVLTEAFIYNYPYVLVPIIYAPESRSYCSIPSSSSCAPPLRRTRCSARACSRR